VRDGFYSLGDIAVNSYTKPSLAFLVKLTDENDVSSLRNPTGYGRVWTDAGSGASQDLTIWRPNCPGGYRAMGHVATNGASPSTGAIKCVKADYLEASSSASWSYIWNDRCSGASRDATFYEATAVTTTQQGIRAFSAIASHSGHPGTPYLLKNSAFNYIAEKPVDKYVINFVEYDLNQERKIQSPVRLAPTIVENNSDELQPVNRDLACTRTESSTFQFSQAIQIGVAVEFSGGVPLVGGSKTTVSLQLTSTFTTGSTTTTSQRDSLRATINTPPHTRQTAYIEGQEYTSDIPYTAHVIKYYYDGTTGTGVVTGSFKGVAVTEFTVKYSEPEPI